MERKPQFFKQKENYQSFVRTRELCDSIDKSFKRISDESREPGYLEKGADEHGFMLDGLSSTNQAMLNAKLASSVSLPLFQCDIGAGDFSYNAANDRLYGTKVVTYGLTAQELRSKYDQAHTPSTYIIGQNAEYLSKIFKENMFDFIFSRATFRHFVDPIGSLIEAYKTLKIGGVIVIDQFSIPGCEKYAEALIDYLRKQGYRVLGSGANGKVTDFIIQKTEDKPTLIIPLTLNHIGQDPYADSPDIECAYYSPNNFLKDHKSMLDFIQDDLYQKGKALIEKETQPYTSILSECKDLPALFNHPEYVKLDNTIQYLLILQMVANEIETYGDVSDVMQQGLREDNKWKSFGDTLHSILESNNLKLFTTLFYLPSDMYFKQNSAIQQIRLIFYVAVQDIMLRGKREETMQMLAKMGIPFKIEDRKAFYTESLNYPKIAAEYNSHQIKPNATF